MLLVGGPGGSSRSQYSKRSAAPPGIPWFQLFFFVFPYPGITKPRGHGLSARRPATPTADLEPRRSPTTASPRHSTDAITPSRIRDFLNTEIPSVHLTYMVTRQLHECGGVPLSRYRLVRNTTVPAATHWPCTYLSKPELLELGR